MILILGVDAPNFLLAAIPSAYGIYRGFGSKHGVVLIVVSVHSVSADRIKIGKFI